MILASNRISNATRETLINRAIKSRSGLSYQTTLKHSLK